VMRFRIVEGDAANSGPAADRGTMMTKRICAGWLQGTRAVLLSVFFGEGQRPGGGIDPETPSGTRSGTIFRPAKIYLKDGIVPDQLLLREAPTISIETRFVDAQGRPVRGDVVGLWGTFPQVDNQPDEDPAIFEGQGLSAIINGPEREHETHNFEWATGLVADNDGRLLLKAPKGLRDVGFSTRQPDETTSIATRLGDEPLIFFGGGQIEELKSDVPNVTFVVYRAPTIRARCRFDSSRLQRGRASEDVLDRPRWQGDRQGNGRGSGRG
jgi:hypothetical protein